ncbi:MAG: hypothetical protein RBT05_05610, partial [Bacteroidales bacterium]|nr:hypothetical protein [Bacteroidales bacterium]
LKFINVFVIKTTLRFSKITPCFNKFFLCFRKFFLRFNKTIQDTFLKNDIFPFQNQYLFKTIEQKN